MLIVSYEADGEVPATGSLDISLATQLTADGPYWACLTAWVHTADPAAGFLGFNLFYTDPTGVEREYPMDNAVLILSDSTSIFSAPVRQICRQTTSSSWHLERTLLNDAGNALVSYRVTVSPRDDSDISLMAFPE